MSELDPNSEIELAHQSQNLSSKLMIGGLAIAGTSTVLYEVSHTLAELTGAFGVGTFIGGAISYASAWRRERVQTDLLFMDLGGNPFRR